VESVELRILLIRTRVNFRGLGVALAADLFGVAGSVRDNFDALTFRLGANAGSLLLALGA